MVQTSQPVALVTLCASSVKSSASHKDVSTGTANHLSVFVCSTTTPYSHVNCYRNCPSSGLTAAMRRRNTLPSLWRCQRRSHWKTHLKSHDSYSHLQPRVRYRDGDDRTVLSYETGSLTAWRLTQVFQQQPVEVEHYICEFWPASKALPTNKDSLMELAFLLERGKRESGDKTIICCCLCVE